MPFWLKVIVNYVDFFTSVYQKIIIMHVWYAMAIPDRIPIPIIQTLYVHVQVTSLIIHEEDHHINIIMIIISM